MRGRGVAASLAFLSSGAAAGGDAPVSYVVAPIRSELTGSQTVGARRSGLICAPAGSLRWSEVKPDPALAARIVAGTLSRRGIVAELPADDRIGALPPEGERRIVGDVIRVRATACVKQYGLLQKLSPKRSVSGRGEIAIRWRIHRAGTREPEVTYITCAAFELNGDAREPHALLDEGVAAASLKLAALLAGRPDDAGCASASAELEPAA